MLYAEPCSCIGRPLRFEPGVCFTCGRLLAAEIATNEPAGDNAGYMKLLAAVHRTANKRARQRAPRKRHRRVVIDHEPSRALQSVRGLLTVC